MPFLPTLGRIVGTGVRASRMLVRGGLRSGAWATRRVGNARAKGAANEAGMVRLFDLHALSCAGDALIAIGLAGTIFFNVPLGEARSKVALYLLITMVPFALLAPVVGPLLDHFRHGRRYALATTMLGRAFLAYVISDNLLGFGLYPAAFGVLALSRAYGVARSAAVPRLLPEGVGLSQVGARASVYGTFAGAVVAPIGLAAFWFGPQWSLRVASIIFIVGMVVALRLPPRADSDPPEAVPRPFRTMLRLRRGEDRPLSGRLVVNTLIGSASLRLLYGFLLLFFAFAIKAGQLETTIFGRDVGSQVAVAVVGGALVTGTFLSTAIGTRLRIRRPTVMQSSGLTITAGVAVLATIFYNLGMVALLALVAATFSGISKLAIDASIQERVPERLRASAFAHSETVLMIAWVLGGAIGIIPLNGRLGVALAAAITVAAAIRAAIVAARLHGERLHGRPDGAGSTAPAGRTDPPPGRTTATRGEPGSTRPGPAMGVPGEPSSPRPGRAMGASGGPGVRASGPSPGSPTGGVTGPWRAEPAGWAGDPAEPGPDAPAVAPATRGTSPAPPPRRGRPADTGQATARPGRARGTDQATAGRPDPDTELNPTLVDAPSATKRKLGWRRKQKAAAQPARPAPEPPSQEQEPPRREHEHRQDSALAPPGFHVYRPSSAGNSTEGGDARDNR